MFRRPNPASPASSIHAERHDLGDVVERAMGFAQKFETPMTPEIYEVWYTYATRENPKVNEALDLAMNTGQTINGSRLMELYQSHISKISTTDALAMIGNDLQGTLTTVSDAVDENLKENSLFSGTLRDAKRTLSQGSSKREVSDVIRDLHRANHQHLAAAQKLAVQLDKSRAQVAKLKSELHDVKRASTTDYLTGLPNRRAMDEAVDTAIFEARQKGHGLGVLVLQIDGLEQVSQEYGISTSDGILQAFAVRAAEELGRTRTIFRFAGAKFAIAVPEGVPRDGFTIAEQLRARFQNLVLRTRDSGEPIEGLSIGFGGTFLRDGDDRLQIIDRADLNLRQAQAEGPNRTLID